VAQYDRAVERRLQAERDAIKAEARARREAELELRRGEERGRLRALLSDPAESVGAPLLALAEGTTSGAGIVALAPLAGAMTSRAGISGVLNVAIERRQRKEVWETNWKSLETLRARIDPRRSAIEQERAPLERQHLEYIRLRQAIARAHEPRSTSSSPFEATEITPKEQAVLDAAADELRPVWQRLNVLREEDERLAAEEEVASGATAKAREEYHRWLEIECEMRRQTMDAPRRVCECDGVELLDDTRPFCSDECQRRYEPFNFPWFAQCERCHRYFAADAVGGTGGIPRLDGTTYCSWLCVATSPEDLDEWPAEDAPCWAEVRYMPHPPLTAHERAAVVRRQLLRQRFGKRRPVQPSVVSEGLNVPSLGRSSVDGVQLSAPLMIAPGNGAEDLSPTEKGVLAVLRAAAGEMTRAQLLAAVRLRDRDVLTAIKTLIARGLVLRAGRGRPNDPFRFRAVEAA